jgi:hypothetical protein
VCAIALGVSLAFPAVAEVADPPTDAESSTEADAAGADTGSDLPSMQQARFASDPAALAPIGVPHGNTLGAGDWSLSYRYSIVHQDDLRNNTSRKSTDEVLGKFREAPRRRDLQTHRFGLSYAPHERVTLAVAVPVHVTRTHVTARGGDRYTTDTSGVGDVEVRALVPFMRNGRQSLHVEMGLTAPTGSTGEHGRNGADQSQRLSFQQQLGSGTVDLLPGVVYRGFTDQLSWGVVGRGVFRVYKNSKNYRGGDHYSLATWLGHSWTDWMSTSMRVSWERWQNIHGANRTNQNPELDPKRHAGELIELGPGVNFKLPFERGPRLGVEMAWPVWQSLEGPQLERDWRLTAGWRWEF